MRFDSSPTPVNAYEPIAEAYEVKFLLPADRADGVEEWARAGTFRRTRTATKGDTIRPRCTADTDGLDVYHRSPGFKRSKHRLRRYGESDLIFLERKKRKGDRVRKKRVEVPAEDLALLEAEGVSPDWAGAWYYEQLRRAGCGRVPDRLRADGVRRPLAHRPGPPDDRSGPVGRPGVALESPARRGRREAAAGQRDPGVEVPDGTAAGVPGVAGGTAHRRWGRVEVPALRRGVRAGRGGRGMAFDWLTKAVAPGSGIPLDQMALRRGRGSRSAAWSPSPTAGRCAGRGRRGRSCRRSCC